MADPKKTANAPLPGAKPEPVRHRVLYIQTAPKVKFHPVGSYEQGNKDAEQQGQYLFASIRAEHINKARAAAAPVPNFLEQSEVGGFKVED
jgi:hypothetical protein